MTIQQIYKLAIELGIKNDFRPKTQIEKQLKRIKEKYEKLSKDEKALFDTEKLASPYTDSRIHFDNGVKNIKKVMAGIDIDSAELMMAKYLTDHNSKKPIDLVVAHHPVGKGPRGSHGSNAPPGGCPGAIRRADQYCRKFDKNKN